MQEIYYFKEGEKSFSTLTEGPLIAEPSKGSGGANVLRKMSVLTGHLNPHRTLEPSQGI